MGVWVKSEVNVLNAFKVRYYIEVQLEGIMIFILFMISGYLSSLPVNYKSDSIYNLTI